MNDDVVIKVDSLYKDFKLPTSQVNSVKSLITDFKTFKKRRFEVQHALKDINFEVKKGEFFGIVGRNGSGKSTLLKIIAGVYQPTKGSITTKGKIVPFIELGVGFNADLSGKDNVYLNGAMLGFSDKEVSEKYKDIVEFAELERFMDQKLKNYSSGMQVRLAFSVATILAESDILLLDEVLAVGDADFQRKCFTYFRNLKKQKKTVVFVSHDMNAIREYCDRAVLIEKSEIIASGTAQKVATEYTRLFIDQAKDKNGDKSEGSRWGDGMIKFTSIELEKTKIDDSTDYVVLNLEAEALADIDDPMFGFLVKNAAGSHILGTNNVIVEKKVSRMKKGDKVKVRWQIPNIFSDGVHFIDPAAVYNGGAQVADWWEDAIKFNSYRSQKTPYLVNPHIKLEVK